MQKRSPARLSTLPYRSVSSGRGMTLVEVMVAMLLLVLVFAGIIAGFIQSRRLTEGSIAQNAALSAVNSYIEQIRNIVPVSNILANPVPTLLNYNTAAGLAPSTGTPPDISTLTPGVTPATIVDNLQDVPSNVNNPGPAIAWTTLWPKANNYPATANANSNDLHLNIWLWVNDLTPSNPLQTKAYGITVIYTWQFWTGFGNAYYIGSFRTVRSATNTY